MTRLCSAIRLLALSLSIVLTSCGTDAASSPPVAVSAEDTIRLFDYDASAPLDAQTVRTEQRDGYTEHEISYASPKGGTRVPVVLDNLIAKKEVPVTIGVFINPGVFKASAPGARKISR